MMLSTVLSRLLSTLVMKGKERKGKEREGERLAPPQEFLSLCSKHSNQQAASSIEAALRPIHASVSNRCLPDYGNQS